LITSDGMLISKIVHKKLKKKVSHS